jgi:hypothetical protein
MKTTAELAKVGEGVKSTIRLKRQETFREEDTKNTPWLKYTPSLRREKQAGWFTTYSKTLCSTWAQLGAESPAQLSA